jgi:hypothetical protein
MKGNEKNKKEKEQKTKNKHTRKKEEGNECFVLFFVF